MRTPTLLFLIMLMTACGGNNILTEVESDSKRNKLLALAGIVL